MPIKQLKFSWACWWFSRSNVVVALKELRKVNRAELVDFDYEEFRGCLKSRFEVTITGTVQGINAFSAALKEIAS